MLKISIYTSSTETLSGFTTTYRLITLTEYKILRINQVVFIRFTTYTAYQIVLCLTVPLGSVTITVDCSVEDEIF